MQKLFIGGKWREAAFGRDDAVVDPSTGEAYDAIPRGGADDIDAAVSAARAAYEGAWGETDGDRARPHPDENGGADFRQPRGTCSQVEARDTGKPMARRAPI